MVTLFGGALGLAFKGPRHGVANEVGEAQHSELFSKVQDKGVWIDCITVVVVDLAK